MAFLFGIPVGLAGGLGHLAAHAGQNLSHGLNAANGGQGTVSPTSAGSSPATGAPVEPGKPRGDLAWGGDAYILTGDDAHNWLRERGLMQGDRFTDKFWNEFYEPLPSDDRPPVEGLHAVCGDWSYERNQPPGVISILVDDPSEQRPVAVSPSAPAGGGPEPDAPPAPVSEAEDEARAEEPDRSKDARQEEDNPADDEQDRKTSGPVRVIPVAPLGPAKDDKPAETPKPPEPVVPTQRFTPGSNGDKIQRLLDERLKGSAPPLVNARWELTIGGSGGETYSVRVEGGRYEVSEGPATAPNVVVTMPQYLLDAAASEEGVSLWEGIPAIKDLRIQEDGSGLQTLKDLGIAVNPMAVPPLRAKIEVDRLRFGPPHA